MKLLLSILLLFLIKIGHLNFLLVASQASDADFIILRRSFVSTCNMSYSVHKNQKIRYSPFFEPLFLIFN